MEVLVFIFGVFGALTLMYPLFFLLEIQLKFSRKFILNLEQIRMEVFALFKTLIISMSRFDNLPPELQ
jgi:hypothetical protein